MSAPLTDDDLRELEALCESARPGPWTTEAGAYVADVWAPDPEAAGGQANVCEADNDDAAFIAAARAALPALVAEVRQLRALLRDVLPLVRECAAETSGYGFFPGGDPRDFLPDEDSTPEERAAWEADCARWDAAEGPQPPEPSSGTWGHATDAAGNVTGAVHIRRAGYGLGSYVVRDPELVALRARLEAAVGDSQ